MARFEIIDDSDTNPCLNECGGEIDISNIPILRKKNAWTITMSDDVNANLPVEYGGTIETINTQRNDNLDAIADDKNLLGQKTRNAIVLILVAAFVSSFLFVVFHQVSTGNLDFQDYMTHIFAILAGLGLGKFGQTKQQ